MTAVFIRARVRARESAVANTTNGTIIPTPANTVNAIEDPAEHSRSYNTMIPAKQQMKLKIVVTNKMDIGDSLIIMLIKHRLNVTSVTCKTNSS